MDKLKAFGAIAVQAGRGESFPTNINVSLKIKRLLDDANCNLADAARLLIATPLIAARAVALANAAAHNPRNGSRSLI